MCKEPNKAFEYCHFEGIEYIVNSISKPLKIDLGLNSINGIRVQVEFDETVPLRRSMRLIGVGGQVIEVKIDYEFTPPQCHHCRVFGHDEGRCVRRIPEKRVEMRWQKVELKIRETEKLSNVEPR